MTSPTKSKNQYEETVKLIGLSNQELNQNFEKAILFMGTTGAGKSFITNGIGDYHIEIIKDENSGDIKGKGSGIGSDYGSCTKIPRMIEKWF
jgi:hypothetical protein